MVRIVRRGIERSLSAVAAVAIAVCALGTFHGAVSASVAASQAPFTVVLNYGSGTVVSYSLVTDTLVSSVNVPSAWVGVYDAATHTYYVAEYSYHTIQEVTVDPTTGALTLGSTINTGTHIYPYAKLLLSPSGTTLYEVGYYGTINVVNLTTNAVTSVNGPAGANVYFAAMSPDGSTIYVSDYVNNAVELFYTATDTYGATITGISGAGGIAVSPNGSTVYVAGYSSNEVYEIATSTNTVSGTISSPQFSGLWVAAVSPDGKTLYVVDYATTASLHFIQLSTGTVTKSITVGQTSYPYLGFSANGSVMYLSSYDQSTMFAFSTAGQSLLYSTTFGRSLSSPSQFAILPAGSISAASWSASSTTVGAGASYTWTMPTASTSTVSSITATLPAGTTASGLTVTAASNISTGTVSISGNTLTYTSPTPAMTAAGTVISFTVSGFTNASTPGSYTSTVTTYDANGDEIDSGTTGALALQKSATTTALVASPASPAVGTGVTLTATVTAASGAAPTGSVTFSDGSTTLGTGTLVASSGSSATASYTAPLPPS